MAETRTGLVGTIAARFLEEREALAERMTRTIRDQVTEFGDFDGAELWEAVRASCLANIDAGLGALRADRELPERIPGEARDLALLTARLGVPLAALLRSYRVGHAMMWEAWFDAVEGSGAPEDERRAATAEASAFLFAYVDRLAGFLTDEYTAERDRYLRSHEQRRTQLVRDVLDGADPDPAEAVGALGYDLRLHHLGLVASGRDAEAALRALAAEVDAPHRLVLALAGDTAWAWLGRTRAFEALGELPTEGDAVVSAGDPAPGTEGFRRSHAQAREAHAVALRLRPGSVVRYDEVALEALVVGSPQARAFAERELRGIDGPDARSRRLRETLRAYFAAGQNASAAAAMLGVHEHTVAYRLRTIEERIGRPVSSRRAELETALRLHVLRD
ncbi:MAG TPA: helix-turn-helix domain-containing protein [Solirubrobacterales bacterium]